MGFDLDRPDAGPVDNPDVGFSDNGPHRRTDPGLVGPAGEQGAGDHVSRGTMERINEEEPHIYQYL
jgi:hypothetical protein